MALLSVEQRKQMFSVLGYSEYNEASIKKFQKDYLRTKDVDGIYGTNTDNALRHVYNVKRYTKNFEPSEFKCDCGGRLCTGYPTYMKPSILCTLQSERDHYNKSCIITSGMRCSKRNKELNGSILNSRHLTGLAADHYIQGATDTLANRKSMIKFLKTLPYFRWAYGNGIDSDGNYQNAPYMGNAIHVDCDDVSVEPKEKKAYSGEFPTLPTKVTKTANQQCLEAVVAYAKKICADDSYGYKRATTNAQLKSCPICNPILGKNTNCIGFCGLSLKHGGGVPVKCAEDGLGNNNFFTKVTLSTWKKRNGNDWVMVSNGGKKGGKAIGKSSLKAGDVCIQYNTDGTSQHLCLYIGDGKVAEAATSSVKKAKQVRVADYSGRRVNRAFRYTGKGKFTDIVSGGYFKNGDKGDEVKKLQAFLNWYGSYGLAEDGIFGSGTESAVKKFQSANGLTADGCFGTASLNKAKEIKK